MIYHLRTIIEGRRFDTQVNYKREIKEVIEIWNSRYGEKFTYVDIYCEIEKYRALARNIRKEEPKIEKKQAPVINWPKPKSWLEKYGT